MNNRQERGFLAKVASILFVASTVSAAGEAQAQVQSELMLEEVVVTAQRREQNLQDVPIAIDVYSGDTIDIQGYRNLEDLSKFNPSVLIQEGVQEQDTSIRGFGSSGNSRTLLSATPIFQDGVYYGRTSMVKTAFLDTERVEILKGPQPLFFGLNATAGAFNITSKKPTPEWEATISGEYGNDGKNEIFGAISGPLTDTLGIRVVGLFERNDGHVRNIVDTDRRVADFDHRAGRVTLEWDPTDNLNVLAKIEGSFQRNGSELRMGCLTEGPVSGYSSRSGPFEDGTDDAAIGLAGYGDGVLADPPDGIPYDLAPIENLRQATGTDCFSDDVAFNLEGPFPTKTLNISSEASEDPFGGSVSIDKAADAFWSREGVIPAGEGGFKQFYGDDVGGIGGREHINSINTTLDITYVFDNGFTVNSTTGISNFSKFDTRQNSNSPFLQNFQVQAGDMAQWSEEIRIETPSYNLDFAGGANVDFMFGGIIQDLKIDTHSYYPKDNVRRGLRTNVTWEDVRWYSAFWNMNFNFMDDQLSLQVGGRYTDVQKDSFIMGAGNQWIFEGRPCDHDPGNNPTLDADPSTCPLDPDFKQIDTSLTEFTTFDAVNGIDSDDGRPVRIDNPILLVDGIDTDDLWTAASWQRTRDIPLNYRSPRAIAVGLTAPAIGRGGVVRDGPFGPCSICVDDLNAGADGYDSQVVLSYSPNQLNNAHTFYVKFAEAFKGPATDLAAGPIPGSPEDITFEPEFSTAWELGAKGSLMDSRIRYSAAAFLNEFKDLQTAAAAPPFNPGEQASVSLNAGKQEVKGLELSVTAAVTDRLIVNFAGALMDGEMVEFDGAGCENSEAIAASIVALENPGDRSVDELDRAEEFLSLLGPTRRALLPSASQVPDELLINGGCRLEDSVNPDGTVAEEGTIDRSGEISARTPKWNFVLGLDYEIPIFDDHLLFFNGQGFISDGYITEETAFFRHVKFNDHGDINLTAGLGDRDGTWRILGYARNILEATKAYNPEYDLEFRGIVNTETISGSSFLQYGVRVEYNFR